MVYTQEKKSGEVKYRWEKKGQTKRKKNIFEKKKLEKWINTKAIQNWRKRKWNL